MDDREELLKDIRFTLVPRQITVVAFLVLSSIFKLTGLVNISYKVVFCLLFWLLTTLPFKFIVEKIETKEAIENFQFLYFIIEVFLLTMVVHYFGGIVWVSGIFYVFTIIYGSIVLPRRKAIYLIFFILTIFNLLIVLELFKALPHYNIFSGADFYVNNPDLIDHFIVLAVFVNILLASVGIFLGILGGLLKTKKEKLEEAYKKIEEEKMMLEIRIRARTEEAEMASGMLKTKVQESTKALRDKITDLEKVNKFTQGREEKLKLLLEDLKENKVN